MSDRITVPGWMNSCTSRVTKVSLVRSGTRNVRARPLPLSTIPNTHAPSETRPRLYLRLCPNIDSSISIKTLEKRLVEAKKLIASLKQELQSARNNSSVREPQQPDPPQQQSTRVSSHSLSSMPLMSTMRREGQLLLLYKFDQRFYE